jgi:hypothetical protein
MSIRSLVSSSLTIVLALFRVHTAKNSPLGYGVRSNGVVVIVFLFQLVQSRRLDAGTLTGLLGRSP